MYKVTAGVAKECPSNFSNVKTGTGTTLYANQCVQNKGSLSLVEINIKKLLK